eukprot:Hpha_TRINITY_DN9969_c0_g1::TRINITY_DN9969_c0_g1_i1::g.140541::m.140541
MLRCGTSAHEALARFSGARGATAGVRKTRYIDALMWHAAGGCVQAFRSLPAPPYCGPDAQCPGDSDGDWEAMWDTRTGCVKEGGSQKEQLNQMETLRYQAPLSPVQPWVVRQPPAGVLPTCPKPRARLLPRRRDAGGDAGLQCAGESASDYLSAMLSGEVDVPMPPVQEQRKRNRSVCEVDASSPPAAPAPGAQADELTSKQKKRRRRAQRKRGDSARFNEPGAEFDTTSPGPPAVPVPRPPAGRSPGPPAVPVPRPVRAGGSAG